MSHPRDVRFPWYDYPFLNDAYAEFWSKLRTQLTAADVRDLPPTLSPATDLDDLLNRPNLLISQTCGYDIAVPYPRPLEMIFTPSYAAPGCERGHYVSLLVVTKTSGVRQLSDLKRPRFTANDARSYSGYHCVRALWPSFATIDFSGGHRESLAAVRRGDADLAAIDAITWEFHRLYEPSRLEGLRVIARTAPAPAPPLVTSVRTSAQDLGALRRAFRAVLAQDPALCRRLLIDDFVSFDDRDYAFMAPPTSDLKGTAPKPSPPYVPGPRHRPASCGRT